MSKYPDWKATNGIFYTIYGAPTKGSKFHGVAIVNGNSDNPQVAFGKTKDEAFRNYKKLIASLGKVSGVTPQKSFEMKEIKGKVIRINDANLSNGYVFHLIVEGNAKRFSVDPGVNALSDIVLTNVGDRVVLKVMNMEEDIVPVDEFTNLDLPRGDNGPVDIGMMEESACHLRYKHEKKHCYPQCFFSCLRMIVIISPID
ncbi:hypothetical protein Q8G35_23735 [Peribacillus simplex]|uniref:Uncharacterized protein n=2 Tax=Peribacillus TaxID=2675229 RepID=A0AA90T348_9BACI|nr:MULTISPECIES: hypothetical protein [Peribacillus]MDP1421303.1 hypothetical protein [Peribacillus simplex]MDP1453989.1 hypothetical protein [Peribacillus frigoritolerans]